MKNMNFNTSVSAVFFQVLIKMANVELIEL